MRKKKADYLSYENNESFTFHGLWRNKKGGVYDFSKKAILFGHKIII